MRIIKSEEVDGKATLEFVKDGVFTHVLVEHDPCGIAEDMSVMSEDDLPMKVATSHGRYCLGQEAYRNKTAPEVAEILREILGLDDDVDQADIYQNAEDHGGYVFPLYLLDHSGLTVSLTQFGCQWDSGQLGVVFGSLEELFKDRPRINDELSDYENARMHANNLIEHSDLELRGCVQQVTIKTFDVNETALHFSLSENVYETLSDLLDEIPEEFITEHNVGGYLDENPADVISYCGDVTPDVVLALVEKPFFSTRVKDFLTKEFITDEK